MIPMIETERLILRRPEPRDEDAYVAFGSSENGQNVGGNGSRYRAWQMFAVELGHWAIRGWGPFAVDLRETGNSVGWIGPWHPLGNPEPEIGWMVWADAEGKGIAREAAEAARQHAYTTLGWTTAVSYMFPGNTRSIALAERLGAERDEAADLPEGDTPETCFVYRHPSPATLAQGAAA